MLGLAQLLQMIQGSGTGPMDMMLGSPGAAGVPGVMPGVGNASMQAPEAGLPGMIPAPQAPPALDMATLLSALGGQQEVVPVESSPLLAPTPAPEPLTPTAKPKPASKPKNPGFKSRKPKGNSGPQMSTVNLNEQELTQLLNQSVLRGLGQGGR